MHEKIREGFDVFVHDGEKAFGAVRAATLLDDAERYGLDPDAIGLTNGSGRLGEPEEIGYGVLFFASDASTGSQPRPSIQNRAQQW